jgi:hypothetical protein
MQFLSGLKLESRELRKSEIEINRFRKQIHIVYIVIWIALSTVSFICDTLSEDERK